MVGGYHGTIIGIELEAQHYTYKKQNKNQVATSGPLNTVEFSSLKLLGSVLFRNTSFYVFAFGNYSSGSMMFWDGKLSMFFFY